MDRAGVVARGTPPSSSRCPLGISTSRRSFTTSMSRATEMGVANKLHLFDVEKPAPAPVSGIDFDKGDIKHQMTSFLYPDDSDDAGRLLRVLPAVFPCERGRSAHHARARGRRSQGERARPIRRGADQRHPPLDGYPRAHQAARAARDQVRRRRRHRRAHLRLHQSHDPRRGAREVADGLHQARGASARPHYPRARRDRSLPRRGGFPCGRRRRRRGAHGPTWMFISRRRSTAWQPCIHRSSRGPRCAASTRCILGSSRTRRTA